MVSLTGVSDWCLWLVSLTGVSDWFLVVGLRRRGFILCLMCEQLESHFQVAPQASRGASIRTDEPVMKGWVGWTSEVVDRVTRLYLKHQPLIKIWDRTDLIKNTLLPKKKN